MLPGLAANFNSLPLPGQSSSQWDHRGNVRVPRGLIQYREC